jgi:hypothetical protein
MANGSAPASSAEVEHNHDEPIARRRFLRAALACATGALAPAPKIGRAQADLHVRLAVAYERGGHLIAPDFMGLSYESSALAAGDYFSPDNSSVLGLIRLLGRDGVIRIGGNTSERTVWNAERTVSESFAVRAQNIDRLAAFMRAVDWKLIYGLNLARGTLENAAAEAAYAARTLGARLLAFQIGNEPDGFGRWRGLRPRTYDAGAFLAEWTAFHAAVRAQVPHARFAGPDVAADTDWVDVLAAARPPGLVLLTRHYYAQGPAGAPHVTLAGLLRSDGQIVPILEKLGSYSSKYALPYRITEVNSVYDEGQPGVSDTLGAALWGLELMFHAAAAGAAGANFHAGIHNRQPEHDKAYTPIARSTGGRYRAAPLFYGMLMFAQLRPGTIVPTYLAPASSELRAFAARGPDGGLQVCLINKHDERGAQVTIDTGRSFAAASMMRLSGPAATAAAGVTLGGASIDEFGGWSPATAQLPHSSPEITVHVPPASAALISMPA